ncbi:glucose-induced degradation complex subunit GID8 [Kluyveromyces lactis]|uniref:KLLA0F17138p n=1 Tax=Kluyveromyces lactis (strain ATCC 8585 / CBS 2359 / DSM 70799 / NBRC 1267 / NRRL Y-1140 / WM37) TaxID=284590 RepID=Q6CJN9_KLULA|nr:uncharacterized protein KLLA0_F17138g [Kluyveromyces lactis]CAG98558.1 KLLA0F17138p [Kluyveromyces lactis]|eukprot:XP_455850.1 uncharacterized protein KLLA0_F17138g [Kluyveromyces lactis]
MTNFKSTYEKKSFTREQWMKVVQDANPYDRSNSELSNNEPVIPMLLLNYFVVMAYEESSIRMAKELGFLNSNKDIEEFNSVYMIKKRAYIKELIKKGEILLAMEKITEVFGIEVLESLNDHITDEDLNFKLLLLNLIEMIRSHNAKGDPNDQEQFILELISYAQDKLALKASSKKEYMKEVELVMTLLLFPLSDEDGSSPSAKLPKKLKQLYSLNMRTKVADLVNRKLLQSILPRINSQLEKSGLPDILGSSFQSNRVPTLTNVIRSIPRESITTERLTGELAHIEEKQGSSMSTNSDMSRIQGEIFEELGENLHSYYIPNDVRLVQIMKLWVWCENQLHSSDVGVPRVEGVI